MKISSLASKEDQINLIFAQSRAGGMPGQALMSAVYLNGDFSPVALSSLDPR